MRRVRIRNSAAQANVCMRTYTNHASDLRKLVLLHTTLCFFFFFFFFFFFLFLEVLRSTRQPAGRPELPDEHEAPPRGVEDQHERRRLRPHRVPGPLHAVELELELAQLQPRRRRGERP
ncbi:unnamed protein product [Prorocentrum cordatum]|uniref:Uncharacterized protein n=1 Tax=Prorocentrum cordatum TaxID=2364126 RepID=A0ABN9SZ23_9DINO|nr:unnamed protein product [Polarella glacialis]